MAKYVDEEAQRAVSSQAEKRAHILKKYGFTGLLAIISPFLIPIGIDWASNAQRDAILKPLDKRLASMEAEIMFNRTLAASNDMKTMVLSNDWNTLVRHRVRSQSLDKVKEIMVILESAPRTTETDKSRLWTRVKNILFRNTNIYVNELNTYRHPVVGNVGRYLAIMFPMDIDPKREYRPSYSFLAVIKTIVIDSTESNIIIRESLVEYMKAIQDEFFTETSDILKTLERKHRFNDVDRR